jgi:DNA phosphorothioation-dependent restriction protein DptH
MSINRTELIAAEIFRQLRNTADGHCARVDFLEHDEAIAVCQRLSRERIDNAPLFRILTTHHSMEHEDTLSITPDQAIEIRNRKQERLCLFVPSDLVDAAYSSLANSFAAIDGRQLHEAALKGVMKQLPDEAQKALRVVARGTLQASYDQRLDFALEALALDQQGHLDRLGYELWRVGLIADADPDFAEKTRLEHNCRCTIELAYPSRISAMPRERIQNLHVDRETANALGLFFRGRLMNDVSAWSRTLAQQDELTIDRWVFPELDKSDIRRVVVPSFVNVSGVVERYCKLEQLDSAGGSLRAVCGPKKVMVVKWASDPAQPANLDSWSVRIVPSDSEGELDEDSDFVEPKIPRVPGKRRKVTIKLDIEEDDIPTCPVYVRIVPLDAVGNEIVDEDMPESLIGKSTEFFLVKDIGDKPEGQSREQRRTVPTLVYGQLELIANMRESALSEPRPQWIDKDIAYFSLSFPGRGTINVGLSVMLRALEEQIIKDSRNGGCYTLSIDEVRAVEVGECVSRPLLTSDQETWAAFWKAREAFFSRLRKAEDRKLIETTDWTPEFAGAALRYAQSYQALLDGLMGNDCDREQILDALSLDTLLVRVEQEEALIVLPTHPFRVAWLASYSQLLRDWQNRLLAYPSRQRKRAIDMQALRLLEPTNVPAFAHHLDSQEEFIFFQNLRFFHGVALPARVPDPLRRYNDLALILGLSQDQATMGEIQPDQLTDHLLRFQNLHPYVDTLVATLINPYRGTFFAEAIRGLLADESAPDEGDQKQRISTFQITAYLPDERKRAPKALDTVRKQIEQQFVRASDYFLPGLATVVRPVSQLEKQSPPEAHLAVVADLTRPDVTYYSFAQDAKTVSSGNALYGLITRFVSSFEADEKGLRWLHRIVPETARKADHPAGARYAETLTDLHDVYLEACGYLPEQLHDMRPMLQVRLDTARRDLLERLHTRTNWVITLDRFFTLDYYDSPHHPGLAAVARKYVLDYSPETIEGLGHRMMVTTAWHEEIETLLAQAMKELGFASIDQSVSRLLHYLKTISGRLALQSLESPTGAAAAVGLGTVTAWLQQQGRLLKAVLVPVDINPHLFSIDGTGRPQRGERRCDMMLVSFRRNIFDAVFIEVKWRKGQTPVLEELGKDMALQMQGSAQAMKQRFFQKEQRIDNALQRAYLANVLRFYFERARRYHLFDPAAEGDFMEQLGRLEKADMDFRPSYEGYIVSLDAAPRNRPLLIDTQGDDKARIYVLTAQDLEEAKELSPFHSPSNDSRHSMVGDQQQSAGNVAIDHAVGELHDNKEREMTVPLQRHTGSAVAEQAALISHEIVVPLGEDEASGFPIVWSPSTAGSPHLFIMGIPGQGKSVTIMRILGELGKQHVPSLVLDFHGQFADTHDPFIQAISPAIVDAAQGLPFSPFECSRGNGIGGWKANSYALAEIFANVTKMGQMQLDIMYSAIQDAYKARGFADEEAMDLEYPSPEDVLRRIRQEEQSRHVNNVAARCRLLLDMDLFRPQQHAPDLLSSVRGGLVIDLHNLHADMLQLAAGAFVLRKIYRDMFSWGYADRIRLAIVLDEAHRLARDVTLPKIMKEGRKFGIAVVVASQGMGDFHQDILGNAGTKVIFRINHPDSKKVAGFIRGRAGQDIAVRIEQLQVGTAYVQTPDMDYGTTVQMYPLA